MLNFKNPIHYPLIIFGLAITTIATRLRMKPEFIIGMILDMNYMENVVVTPANLVANQIKFFMSHQGYFMVLKALIYCLLGDGLFCCHLQ